MASPRRRASEARAVAGAFATFGALFFDRFAPLYLLPLVAADLGAPSAVEGTLALLIGLGWAAGIMPARLLSGRWSSRRRILVGAVLSGTLGIASTASPTWLVFVLLRGLGGMASGTTPPPVTTFIFAAAPPHRRGRDIGIVQSSTRFVGSLLAPGVVTSVALVWGWRPALVVSGALVLLAAALLAGLVPPEAPLERPRRRSAAALTFHPGARRDVLIAAAGCVVLMGWLVTFSQSAVPFVQGWLGVRADVAGRLVALFGLGAGLAALAIPRLSDRIGRRAALALACAIGGMAGLATTAAATAGIESVLLAGVLLCLAGVAMGGLPLVVSVIPAETVATGDVGRALSIPIIAGEVLGGAAVPAAAAAIAALVGTPVVLTATAGTVAAFTAAATLLQPARGRVGTPSGPAEEDARAVRGPRTPPPGTSGPHVTR